MNNDKNLTLDIFNDDNITLRGKNLVTISVKNDKDEELSLKDVFEQIRKYVSDNAEKIENGIALIASYASGPFFELQKSFIMGYLYCKYVEKLQNVEKSKYEIEYSEREISEEEARHLLADVLDKNVELGKDLAKKLRNGNINPNDIKMM